MKNNSNHKVGVLVLGSAVSPRFSSCLSGGNGFILSWERMHHICPECPKAITNQNYHHGRGAETITSWNFSQAV